jgi:hypothetical protein
MKVAMPTNVESDTTHLNKIDQPLSELVHIWHFGDYFSMLEKYFNHAILTLYIQGLTTVTTL